MTTRAALRRYHSARALLACARILITISPLLIAPTVALCQDLSPPEMATEIWMSGTGVTLWRRVPPGRLAVDRDSDDQFARSMLEIAQRRYQTGDEDTAEWLSQWADHLTNGRLAAPPLGTHLLPVPHPLNLPAEHEQFPPSVLHTLDVATHPTGPHNEPAFAHKSHQADVERQEPPLELPAQREPRVDPRQVALVAASHADDAEATAVGAAEQFALASPHRSDRADPIHRTSPAASTMQPIAIALVSFASGTAFCALICTLLILSPVRLTIERRIESRGRQESEPCTPVRRAASIPEQNNSIVEAFYNKNVELYEQFAQAD